MWQLGGRTPNCQNNIASYQFSSLKLELWNGMEFMDYGLWNLSYVQFHYNCPFKHVVMDNYLK